MKNNFKSTLLLTGILGALIGWYFLYEQKYRPQILEHEEKTKQLVSLNADQIQEVEIVRMKNAPKEAEGANATPDPNFKPEFETTKLKKSGTDWLVTEPISDSADSSQVSSMVSTFASTKQERVVEEKPKDLSPYGLKDPIVRVLAKKDSTSPPEEILIGLNTPVGFSAYAKVAGKDPVFKVSSSLKTAFNKDSKELRNKNIITTPRAEISELEIQNSKENIVLKKDDKDNWTLARDNFAADANEAGKTFSAIVELRAKDFASEKAENLEKFGLQKPAAKATLVLTNKNSPKITVLIGKVKEKYFAKREDKPIVFEIDKNALERLEKTGPSYRSLNLANFNRYDVKRIKVEDVKDPVELVKGEKGEWTIPTETTKKIKTNEVDSLLTSLQDAKISRYGASPKEKGSIKKPYLTLRLFEKADKGEKESVVLRFDSPKAKEILGEREDLSLPFFLKVEDFKKINVNKSVFVEPELKPEEKNPKKS